MKKIIRAILVIPLLPVIIVTGHLTTFFGCLVIFVEIINWICDKETEFDLGFGLLLSPIYWIIDWVKLGNI